MALSCPENEAHFLQAKQHDFRGKIQIRTVLRTNSWLGLQTPLLTSKRNQYFVPLHSSASAHDDLSTYWPTDLQGNQTLKRNLSCVFPMHNGHCSFLWLHYQTILTLGAVRKPWNLLFRVGPSIYNVLLGRANPASLLRRRRRPIEAQFVLEIRLLPVIWCRNKWRHYRTTGPWFHDPCLVKHQITNTPPSHPNPRKYQ